VSNVVVHMLTAQLESIARTPISLPVTFYTVSQKVVHQSWSITLPILHGFSKIFHWQTPRTICDKLSSNMPPRQKRVPTLPRETRML